MDLTKTLKAGGNLLSQVAPTIAGMLGGPFAGQAVAALEGALGLSPTGDADAAVSALAAATPDQLLALKAEDNRHAEALQKMGIDVEALAEKDRDSARLREMTVKDGMNAVLGTLTLAGFFLVVTYVLTVGLHMEAASAGIVGSVIGFVSSKADLVLSYYFGSSKGGDALAAHIAGR